MTYLDKMEATKSTKSFEFDYENEKKEIIHLKQEGQEYENIFRLAIAYKLKFDSEFNMGETNDFTIGIPVIDTINDVKCFVELCLSYSTKCIIGSCKFQLRIMDVKVFCEDTEEEEMFPILYSKLIYISPQHTLTNKDFVKAIMITLYYGENLKFDKVQSYFSLNTYNELDLACKVFGSCSNIKLDADKCVCCFEYTRFKLMRCKHYICVLCKGKLDSDRCPTCRKHIYDSDKDPQV